MAKPLTSPKRTLIDGELAKQANLDMPLAQRPTRVEAGITRGASTAYGYGGPQVEVMGPGRGIGWIYVGWLDDDTLTPSLGQVHKDQLIAPPVEPVVEPP